MLQKGGDMYRTALNQRNVDFNKCHQVHPYPSHLR